MSLLHKAWCETRSRFAIALATLAAMIALGARAPLGDSTKMIFAMLAIALGTGSLRQEHAHGTLGFSLALPVPRAHLVGARVAVGVAQIAALAGFAALCALVVAAIAGAPVAASHALRLAVVWAACGTLLLCLTQLLASLVASDAVAFLAAFLIVLGYEAALQLTRLPAGFDLFQLMSSARLPWLSLVGLGALSAALIAVAERRTRRLAL